MPIINAVIDISHHNGNVNFNKARDDGIIGVIQATEAIKLILGVGEALIGRFLIYDALKMRFRELKLRKDPECPVCGTHPTVTKLIDYEQFCGIQPAPVLSHLDLALRAIVFSAVGTAGQRCTSLRRLLVHDDVYDSLVPRLKAIYQRLEIGDPLDANTLVGPLIDAANPAGCSNENGVALLIDQRGMPRSNRCDIGAYEAPDGWRWKAGREWRTVIRWPGPASEDAIIRAMVGREMADRYPRRTLAIAAYNTKLDDNFQIETKDPDGGAPFIEDLRRNQRVEVTTDPLDVRRQRRDAAVARNLAPRDEEVSRRVVRAEPAHVRLHRGVDERFPRRAGSGLVPMRGALRRPIRTAGRLRRAHRSVRAGAQLRIPSSHNIRTYVRSSSGEARKTQEK